MRLKTFLPFSALLFLAFAQPALADGKVGFLHPQRVLNESRMGKMAQADLARFAQEKDRVIRDQVREIEAMQKELASGTLPEAEARRKEDALRVRYASHDRLVQQSNEEIRVEEQRLARYVMQKADTIMKQLAAQQGFTLILTDPESIGYVDKSVDITDQVIRILDQAGPQSDTKDVPPPKIAPKK